MCEDQKPRITSYNVCYTKLLRFLVAEPMKRLGKYTFTDALDSKFNSKGIQLMAAIIV